MTLGEIKCAVCHSDKIYLKYSKEQIDAKLDLLGCRNCGLSFLAPESEQVSEENKYWDNAKQVKIYSEEQIEENFKKDFLRKLGLVRSFFREKGRLLDVGCGTGQFLNIAKGEGWDVYGLDISEGVSCIAKEKYGIRVFVGKPETFESYGIAFDCVTLWDVIEHIKDPLLSLKAVHSHMKDEGLLVIRTPSESALIRKKIRFLAGLGIMSFLKYVYYTPHYFYFQKKTLRLLLEQAGFKVEKVMLENTDVDFAKSKIDAHYKTKEKLLAKFILPVMNFLSNIFGMQNKLVVIARKI